MDIRENSKWSKLFNFAYGTFLIYSTLGYIPMLHKPLQLVSMIGIILLIFGFLFQYRICKRQDFICYCLFLALALITSVYNSNYAFIKLVLFAGSIRCVEMKSIAKFDLKLRTVLIVLLYLMSLVGLATDNVFYYNGVARHSLGFTNPNALGVAVYILVCDIVFLAGNEINIKHLLIITLIAGWLYSVARCRTSVYAILLLLFLAILYKLFPRIYKTKIMKYIFMITPFILSFITYISVQGLIHHNSVALELDKLLSSRLSAVVTFVTHLKPKILGQSIGETVALSMDNAYGFAWYDLGILISLILLWLTIRAFNKYFKTQNIMLCIIILSFICYGISEHLWLFVDYNIFMIAWCPNLVVEDYSLSSFSNRQSKE